MIDYFLIEYMIKATQAMKNRNFLQDLQKCLHYFKGRSGFTYNYILFSH